MKMIYLSETMKAPFRIAGILGVAALAGLILTACASVNPNPAMVVSQYAGDFDSGTAEAKNIWDQVSAAINSDDYVTALSTLEQLQTESGLSTRQLQAIKQTVAAVKRQMLNPAKKGEPNQ